MRLVVTLAVFLLPANAFSQQQLQFSGYDWVISGDARTESYLGREALRFRNGSAVLDGLDFTSGTIEFDVATTGHRSFIGAGFRIEESGRELERFYIRPHNSGRFDAMQYTPEYHGLAAWQLYPEFNATIDIPTERWINIRMVIEGPRLEVFFDGASDPTLVVENLPRGDTHGAVALLANFPANEPDGFYPTAFSNVRVEAREASYPAMHPPSRSDGVIGEWALSPAIAAPPTPVIGVPAVSDGAWTIADADAEGRVNIAQHRGIPQGSPRGTVVARLILETDRAHRARFNFGFSDEGSVFLNGRLLFAGNNTYLSRSGRYLGIMRLENDALVLPLEAGENELTVVVTEAFGGWGVTGRLSEFSGEVRAAAP